MFKLLVDSWKKWGKYLETCELCGAAPATATEIATEGGIRTCANCVRRSKLTKEIAQLKDDIYAEDGYIESQRSLIAEVAELKVERDRWKNAFYLLVTPEPFRTLNEVKNERDRYKFALEEISSFVSLTYVDGPSKPTREAALAQKALAPVVENPLEPQRLNPKSKLSGVELIEALRNFQPERDAELIGDLSEGYKALEKVEGNESG
jgi:hypothetical protein